jgi:L-threonylcarbamoyladenylate synthase
VGTERAAEGVIAALRAGLPVLLPTDTVYGLCAAAAHEDAALGVYRLKGRSEMQPTALLAASVDALYAAIPDLRGEAGAPVRALLPGPYTLVLPNPTRRYRWLAGTRTDAIGVRVPVLPGPAREAVDAVGAVLATSANEPGEPSPARLEDVPDRIRDACAAELDLGPLPGTPSTVIDFTGREPYVIREGIASAADAIERVRAAQGGEPRN